LVRNGCSRVCPCVGSEVAEVVGRPSDPEKRSLASRVNIARRAVGRDGDLARSNLRRSESLAVGAAGEVVARAGFVAETHVTASRNRKRLTRVRGRPPAVEGISGRTERLIFTEGRRKRPRQPGEARRATARRQWPGSDRGVRGTARSEAPGGSNAARQPEEARRSERGVVKRQVHRSPGPGCKPVGPRARRKPRRDAGSSRGAGTRIQAVGSRSRSYASCWCSGASRKADLRMHELARSDRSYR
jgi:hypothetical protein